MYLHAGRDTVIREKKIIAVFDLDMASQNKDTLDFLRRAEKEGRIINTSADLPKSFIVCREKDQEKIYICQLSPLTLIKRTDKK